MLVLSALPGAAALPRDAVFLAAGWFTLGASPEDTEYARKLCVRERSRETLRLRPCGYEELFAHEGPARRVYVSAFWLDRFELSRAEYLACVEGGGCTPAGGATWAPITLNRRPMKPAGVQFASAMRPPGRSTRSISRAAR